MIADRLRALRQQKKLSQGDIEERSGLLRCYISRVENGHTVRRNDREAGKGDDIPLYQFLCDIDELPEIPNLPSFREREATDDADWGNRSEEAHMLSQFRTLIARVKEKDPLLLLSMAQRMAAGAPCGQG